MKRSLMILCASMLVNLTSMAQGNMKYLSRPTIGALPDSWFSGLSGGQIRHIKKPCGALGNIPYILEKYEMPIWITGSKEDKESREKNHQYCDMQTKEVMAELERLKEKEIPASATKDCFISVNAPLRPLRVFNYPAKASYYPYAGIFFYAPYTLKDDAECFWYLKTLAIFISADGYVHISDVIFDGEDGMKGEIKGNVVVGVQVDWRSIYVMNNLSQVIFVHYLKDRYGPAKKKSEEWENRQPEIEIKDESREEKNLCLRKTSQNVSNSYQLLMNFFQANIANILPLLKNTGLVVANTLPNIEELVVSVFIKL